MRQTRIDVNLRLEPLFLAQNPLIYQRLIPQRIRTTNLEVMRRQIGMTTLEDQRTEQLVVTLRHGNIAVPEKIASLPAQDRGVFVLLPGVIILLVLLGHGVDVADGRDHQVATRERRTELLVSRNVGDSGGDVAACGCAAD
jgi:hypothetical protein